LSPTTRIPAIPGKLGSADDAAKEPGFKFRIKVPSNMRVIGFPPVNFVGSGGSHPIKSLETGSFHRDAKGCCMSFSPRAISHALLVGSVAIPAWAGGTPQTNRLAAGEDHLLAVREDGSLWGAGANRFGQLGVGEGPARPLPLSIDRNAWRKVSAGVHYSMAIRADGSLWAFGRNSSAQLGQGTRTVSKGNPFRVDSRRWSDVAAGVTATLAIREDGSLHIWGGWEKHPLASTVLKGGGGRSRLLDKGPWKAVALGADHALALRRDGSLWALGGNAAGQSGCNEAPLEKNLCRIGNERWKAIAAGGNFSVGIREDGSLWSWGGNTLGELGRGAAGEQNGMGRIGSDRWLSISAGSHHVLAIREDSTLWAWGAGSEGALGNGLLDNRSEPARVGTGKWLEAAAGRRFSAALRADGEFLIWGDLAFASERSTASVDPIAASPAFLDRKLDMKPFGSATFGGPDIALEIEANHWDSITVEAGEGAEFVPAAGKGAGAALRITGSGNIPVTIRAFSGAAAPLAATRILAVDKAPQTLALPEWPGLVAGSAAADIGGVSSAGLPVFYTTSDPKVVRVAGSRLKAVAPGTAVITALQPGDANHEPAASVARALTILPAIPPTGGSGGGGTGAGAHGSGFKAWAMDHKTWLIAGGGAAVAGGILWATLAWTADKEAESDLGMPPADPVTGGVP
jgi:alpha-tubulin suppressor-like RCC1 family protein